jgi:hypothetical protein
MKTLTFDRVVEILAAALVLIFLAASATVMSFIAYFVATGRLFR